MTELRLALLALGVLLIISVYVWSRGIPQRWLARIAALRPAQADKPAIRLEPALDGEYEDASTDQTEDTVDPAPPAEQLQKIVTLRFVPRHGPFACDTVMLALRAAGLRHGRFGIFHKPADEFSDDPLFSVANLTEPGSFDLARATETTIPGMSFFMILPGPGDPVDRFDEMVRTARELARELDGELRDEQGSSWSIQRERFVREEIIQFRHGFDRPASEV